VLILNKIDEKKQLKKKALLDTAFKLFTNKGIHKTSISDIADNAGVAKGTFYLYFKDKYDINNKLILHKSSEIIRRADEALIRADIQGTDEQIIFIVDNIISQFEQDSVLLNFLSKRFSWGAFKSVLLEASDEGNAEFRTLYHQVFDEDGLYDEPEIMMYMIMELVGSACYSSILHGEPVGIDRLKPHLLETSRQILKSHHKILTKGEMTDGK
jgi:AcrR family transcriptional regulator